MMQIIPINDVVSQTLQVQLGGQACTINLYQKTYTDPGSSTGTVITALFCDVYVNSTLIIGGVICQNLNRIVREAYLGFVGDFCFQDTEGTSDPLSPGLGTRFLFCYLETSDVSGLD
jgi:hypothetical protein